MEIQPRGNDTEGTHADRASEALVTVTVVLMGELKRWAGRQEVELHLPQGSTIQTVAKRLRALCGDTFEKRVLTRDGAFQPHVAVFVNSVHIGELQGNQTVLGQGKLELMILPSSEGG